MLPVEDILCELISPEDEEHGTAQKWGLHLPPGFRFHPTDEELITFYLASKVFNPRQNIFPDFAEIDLNHCEPWELPDGAKMGQREWYFFSLRDRKFPTGMKTNRTTVAGYWKTTGKDREVFSGGGSVVGMKKTLVFYRGRAPRGEKTKWIMHEYRLDDDFSCRHMGKEEWVICRIFNRICNKKRSYVDAENKPQNPQMIQTLNPFPMQQQPQHPNMKTLISPSTIFNSAKVCKKEVGLEPRLKLHPQGFIGLEWEQRVIDPDPNPFGFGYDDDDNHGVLTVEKEAMTSSELIFRSW